MESPAESLDSEDEMLVLLKGAVRTVPLVLETEGAGRTVLLVHIPKQTTARSQNYGPYFEKTWSDTKGK